MKINLIIWCAILCGIQSVFSSQENQPIVEGDVFIVPYGNCCVNCEEKFSLKKIFGYDLNKCHIFVSVWATSTDSDNWEAHQHPTLEEKNIRFPGYLPLNLLKNKKEGDTIEFLLYNKKNESVMVRLHLNQANYRYGTCSKGKFEECLTKEMKSKEAQKKKKMNVKGYEKILGKNFQLIKPNQLDEYGNPIRTDL